MKTVCPYLLLILSSLLVTKSLAQNLILNPGFEAGDCPEDHATIHENAQINNWESPNLGTPDYFHTCSKGTASVPKNWTGLSDPHSGEAYAGIYLSKGKAYQEHLQTQLIEPLDSGQVYHGTVHVKGALFAEYLPAEISLHLSEQPAQFNSITPYDLRTIRMVFDTSRIWREWKKMSFEYTAKGGEKYLVIGALTTSLERKFRSTNIFGKFPNADMSDAIYIYLDDLYLGKEPFGEYPAPVLQDAHPQKMWEFTLSNVDFEFNQSELRPGTHAMLDTIAHIMHSESVVGEVIGKTDSVGTDNYNYQLGLNRALAVANYLKNQEVPEDRLLIRSEGESNPIAPNDTESGRQLNRVVLIRLTRQ